MEETRSSLWSRLVVYYSVAKKDQLNPKVMAEIVAKYGSKEKELSARLLKKYGRPLPPRVSSQEVRRVLVEFGMEDQDSAGARGTGPAQEGPRVAATTGDESGATEVAEATEAAIVGDDWTKGKRSEHDAQSRKGEEQKGQAEAGGHRPPKGSELNFRSKHFDPLQALRSKTVRPPFPGEPMLDNLTKCLRLLPRRRSGKRGGGPPDINTGSAEATAAQAAQHVASAREAVAAALMSVSTPTGSSAAGGSPLGSGPPRAGDGLAKRVTSAAGEVVGSPPPTELLRATRTTTPVGRAPSGSPRAHQKGEERPIGDDGRSPVEGRCRPGIRSAAEIERMDKEKASRRRSAELLVPKEGARAEVQVSPIVRIMREYAGVGPYSLLYRLHEEKRRASVMIRRVNSIRGTCTGLIRAFDKHMNMLLVDVREDYTAFVPAREPKQPNPQPKPKPNQRPDWVAPLNAGPSGGGDMGRAAGVKGKDGKEDAGKSPTPGVIEGISPAAIAPRQDASGGWGKDDGDGGSSWGGGGSLSWGVVGDSSGGTGGDDSSGRDGAEVEQKSTMDSVEDEAFSTLSTTDDDYKKRSAARERTIQSPHQERRVVKEEEEEEAGKTPEKKKKSTRRSRRKGPWTGELKPVRRQRFLKQLLIRGDNVVMIWECPKRS